jgi:hypothetical protein
MPNKPRRRAQRPARRDGISQEAGETTRSRRTAPSLSDQVQKLTGEHVKKVDDALAAKERDHAGLMPDPVLVIRTARARRDRGDERRCRLAGPCRGHHGRQWPLGSGARIASLRAITGRQARAGAWRRARKASGT